MATPKSAPGGLSADIPPFLHEPYVLPRAVRPALESAVAGFDAALRRAAAWLFAPGGRRWADFAPPEEVADLLSLPLPPDPVPFFRLDARFDPATGRLEVMEFNCADPSGVGLHDALMTELERRRPGGAPLPRLWPSHLAALRAAHAGHPGPVDRAAPLRLVIDPESPTAFDFRLLHDDLRAAGEPVVLLSPREALPLPEGSLVYHDYIYELLSGHDAPLNAAWREAFADGRSCLVTSPHANVLESKAVLELFTSPRRSGPVGPCDSPSAAVLWTRAVTRRRTDFEGREVDLPELLVSRREDFVLKPAYGWGGQGFLSGERAGASRWDDSVARALAEPGRWVAQRRCSPDPDTADRTVLSLWCHRGRLTGAFVRSSAGPAVNVRTGAAVGAAIFA